MRNISSLVTSASAVIVALGFILFLNTGAFAQDAGPCAQDIQTLCPGIQPGGGKLAGCLKANADQLSRGCKIHMLKIARQVQSVGQACEDDVTSLCASAGEKKMEVMQCLQSNEAKLTPDCKSSLAGAMGN
jgi:hypothetical protein